MAALIVAFSLGLSARPDLVLGQDASTQLPFEEMRMSNTQSRLLPATPGFELSDTQTDYFKRRRDRNAGFPGSECYKKCHEKPGKCDHFCAEEGFWTGSCCKFGASGDEQAEECDGRGCIGFHCCVADVVTSEEEQDKWSKRAGSKDEKASTEEKQEGQQQQQQQQQQQAAVADTPDPVEAAKEMEEAQKQAEEDLAEAAKGISSAPNPVAVQAPAPEAVAVAPINDAPAPTPVPLPEDRPEPEQASELGPKPAVSAGLPGNSDVPGNAEDRQHEMEEAQREAEEAQKKGQEEATESQDAVKALNPPENDALDAAVASASAAAESQQRKLEDAQMEAEEKQREAQQEYEKEQAKHNAAADAEREAKSEALKDAAAEASASVKDAYHDAEATVAAAGGGAEAAAAAGAAAAAKAEAEALEDPFGDAKEPSGKHEWINGWSRDSLRHLFLHGTPSNDLKEVGLTVHCFDGTEEYTQPWRPCAAGACKQFAKWWSASIISVKQPATFSNAGIILTPSKTKLLCSFPSDFGTMNAGCKWSDKPNVWQPFDADHTKEMLTDSLDMNSTGNLGAKTLGITMYNEVLVDSKDIMSHMPKSIGAFVFFDDDEYNRQKPYTPLPDKIVATSAYVALLDFYNLTETDIPILQVNRTDGSFMDVSRGARRFLELHSFEQYSKRHPYWQDAWRQAKAQADAQNPPTMRKQLFEKISGSNAQPEYQARPPWNPYAWLETFSRAHGGAPGDWAL